MGELDPNKINLIISLIKEHLVKNESYRIACSLSNAEFYSIKQHYDIEEASDLGQGNFKLWIIKKKQ